MDRVLIFNFAAAMLAVVNPFGNLPIFISYTAGERRQVRNWLAVFIALTIFGLLTVFLVVGTELLTFFGITIPAFQISGGILLLLTGIGMVHGEKSVHNPELTDKLYRNDLQKAESIYSKILVPLGVPLFVGPGAISTVILYSSRLHNQATLIGEIVVLMGISLVVLMTLLIADSPGGEAPPTNSKSARCDGDRNCDPIIGVSSSSDRCTIYSKWISQCYCRSD